MTSQSPLPHPTSATLPEGTVPEGVASAGVARPGIVLTAIGPDRPGLVKDIAGHILKLGGNIEETRMSKLGGEFAALILVTGESAALTALGNSLSQLETALGVSCFIKNTHKSIAGEDGRRFLFEASGFDHPGIVESVTQVFADKGVNVTSLESRIENAPLTGTPIFVMEAEVTLPKELPAADLSSRLFEICDQRGLEFTLTAAEG